MLGVYPGAQATVQDCPLTIEVTSLPSESLPQTSEATLAKVGSADTRQGSGSQVKVSKVPAAHAAEALLGVYPGRQVAVQAAPAAIEVTPSPQDPVEAALATVGTWHAPVEVASGGNQCSHRACGLGNVGCVS
jgi:hypothetical protein